MPSSPRKPWLRFWRQPCGETQEEYVNVVGPESSHFDIREVEGALEITELLMINSLLSEAYRG